MARLTTCPDCGANVSKKAAACPGCGRVMRKRSGCIGGLAKLALLLICLVILIGVLSPKRPQDAANVDVARPRPIPPEGPFDRPATDDVPAYQVVKVVSSSTGRASSIIVPSLSPKDPDEKLESIARAIAQKENLDEIEMYSNEEAMRANKSASYAAEHPAAFKKGYLGGLDHGVFRR